MKAKLTADVGRYVRGMKQANEAATINLMRRLGYRDNDWLGMWKLPPQPIVYRGHGIIILREVIYKRGTTKAIYFRNRALTKLIIRRDPDRA